jgi:hypothetical protein
MANFASPVGIRLRKRSGIMPPTPPSVCFVKGRRYALIKSVIHADL